MDISLHQKLENSSTISRCCSFQHYVSSVFHDESPMIYLELWGSSELTRWAIRSCVFSALRVESVWQGNINSKNGSLTEWGVVLYSLWVCVFSSVLYVRSPTRTMKTDKAMVSRIEIHIMIWCYNIPAIRVLFTKSKTESSSKGSRTTNTVTTIDSAVAKKRVLSPMGSKSPLYPKDDSFEMLVRQQPEHSRGSADRQEVWALTYK